MRTKLTVFALIACMMLAPVSVFAGDLVAALDKNALDQINRIDSVEQVVGENAPSDENKNEKLFAKTCDQCCPLNCYDASLRPTDNTCNGCPDTCDCATNLASEQSVGEAVELGKASREQ